MKPLPRNGEVIITIKDGIGQSWREVRHGRWEYKEEHKGSKYGYYYCSICGMASWASNSPYCPNCGSRMDLDGDTE